MKSPIWVGIAVGSAVVGAVALTGCSGTTDASPDTVRTGAALTSVAASPKGSGAGSAPVRISGLAPDPLVTAPVVPVPAQRLAKLVALLAPGQDAKAGACAAFGGRAAIEKVVGTPLMDKKVTDVGSECAYVGRSGDTVIDMSVLDTAFVGTLVTGTGNDENAPDFTGGFPALVKAAKASVGAKAGVHEFVDLGLVAGRPAYVTSSSADLLDRTAEIAELVVQLDDTRVVQIQNLDAAAFPPSAMTKVAELVLKG